MKKKINHQSSPSRLRLAEAEIINHNYSKGQILIELILAVALASIIISSIIGLFIDIRDARFVSLEQTRAEDYTQEAINALYSIQGASWNDMVNHTYPAHPEVNAGAWELVDGEETIDDFFTRKIEIADVERNPVSGDIVESGGIIDPSTKKFTVTVSWNKPRNLSIVKEIYLTRYTGNTNWTETTEAEFLDGTASDIEVTNDEGGEIKLAYGEGEGSHTGNRFSVYGTDDDTLHLDDANKKVSYRFTAQNTKTVEKIRVYIADANKNKMPTYRYGLQGDNNGNPDGTWLGATQNGYSDEQFYEANEGWVEITLGENVDITEDTIYHLVIEYESGSINAGQSVTLRSLDPLNLVVPYDSSDDENLMTRWTEDGGTNWEDVNRNPIYMLMFTDTDPEAEGNPYYEATDQEVYGNYFKGEIFKYEDDTEFFNRLSVYVKKKPGEGEGQIPEEDLNVTIVDVTDPGNEQELFTGVFISKNDITTDYQLHEIPLDPELTFIEGHDYKFYMHSEGTSQNRSYHIEHATNIDQSPDNEINYQGLNGRYTSSDDAGNTWTTYDNQDTMFRLSAIADTGYFTYGEYTSSTFDAGNEVSFNRISWTELTNASITNVEFQIAVNSDNATWNFVGPDGTSATRYTDPDGGAIPLAYTQGRYIRYKIYLSTVDNAQTPIVYDVSVNYSP